MNPLRFRVPWRVRQWARRMRHRTKAHRIPARWLRRPPALEGRKVCLFVMLASGDRLLPHSIDHARAWHAAGYAVVAIVVAARPDAAIDIAPIDFAAGVMVRANQGYDFGAWAAAIRAVGREVRGYAMLAVTNDSLLGPSSAFPMMIARAERAEADLVGLVDSVEIAPHFQSFALFFKPGALNAQAFRRFWYGVGNGDRAHVIERYEVPLQRQFADAGLRTLALYPVADAASINRTLDRWTDLLDEGFPYLKVRLLRDNPLAMDLSDWRGAAARAGFDMARLDVQITALAAAGGATWAILATD